jgi:hypothetical protein
MKVLVAVDEEARDAGLAPESLRTAVELRLRQSRIPVLDESSVSLSVSVDLVEIAGRGGGYAFSVKLKLREPVYPMRQVLDQVLESDTEPITLGEFFLLRGVPNQAVPGKRRWWDDTQGCRTSVHPGWSSRESRQFRQRAPRSERSVGARLLPVVAYS